VKRILFVCSGNYYRSRLAEILFNHEAQTAGLACEAQSRGLLRVGDIKGLSPYSVRYLNAQNLETLTENPRDPLTLDVEDLTEANLVVALNRAEHQPMIEQKFASLAKALQKAGRLRYWNVYDIPSRPHALVRLMGGAHGNPAQPADSGTEHIALAVKDLIREMGQKSSDI
jgi:protein-tyrosine phosphatase